MRIQANPTSAAIQPQRIRVAPVIDAAGQATAKGLMDFADNLVGLRRETERQEVARQDALLIDGKQNYDNELSAWVIENTANRKLGATANMTVEYQKKARELGEKYKADYNFSGAHGTKFDLSIGQSYGTHLDTVDKYENTQMFEFTKGIVENRKKTFDDNLANEPTVENALFLQAEYLSDIYPWIEKSYGSEAAELALRDNMGKNVGILIESPKNETNQRMLKEIKNNPELYPLLNAKQRNDLDIKIDTNDVYLRALNYDMSTSYAPSGGLGALSSKYESSGDAGAVSTGKGDAGGVSYGKYQFASNMGVPQSFVQWLGNQEGGADIQSKLSSPVNSENFKSSWKQIAKDQPEKFGELQHKFTKERYYDVTASSLKKKGLDVSNRSKAVQDVVWSNSVQHGPITAVEAFTEASQIYGKRLEDMTDAEIIDGVYSTKLSDMSWSSGSPELRPGLFNRWKNERKDALNMLSSEGNRNAEEAKQVKQEDPESITGIPSTVAINRVLVDPKLMQNPNYTEISKNARERAKVNESNIVASLQDDIVYGRFDSETQANQAILQSGVSGSSAASLLNSSKAAFKKGDVEDDIPKKRSMDEKLAEGTLTYEESDLARSSGLISEKTHKDYNEKIAAQNGKGRKEERNNIVDERIAVMGVSLSAAEKANLKILFNLTAPPDNTDAISFTDNAISNGLYRDSKMKDLRSDATKQIITRDSLGSENYDYARDLFIAAFSPKDATKRAMYNAIGVSDDISSFSAMVDRIEGATEFDKRENIVKPFLQDMAKVPASLQSAEQFNNDFENRVLSMGYTLKPATYQSKQFKSLYEQQVSEHMEEQIRIKNELKEEQGYILD